MAEKARKMSGVEIPGLEELIARAKAIGDHGLSEEMVRLAGEAAEKAAGAEPLIYRTIDELGRIAAGLVMTVFVLGCKQD